MCWLLKTAHTALNHLLCLLTLQLWFLTHSFPPSTYWSNCTSFLLPCCVQAVHVPCSCLTKSKRLTERAWSQGFIFNINPFKWMLFEITLWFYLSSPPSSPIIIPLLEFREISKNGGTLLKPSRQCPLDVCVHCKAISHLVVDSKLFWFSSVLVPCWFVATDGKSKFYTSQSVVFFPQILFLRCLLWFVLTFNFLGGCFTYGEGSAQRMNCALISQNCFW